jgi:hypothetical protein
LTTAKTTQFAADLVAATDQLRIAKEAAETAASDLGLIAQWVEASDRQVVAIRYAFDEGMLSIEKIARLTCEDVGEITAMVTER